MKPDPREDLMELVSKIQHFLILRLLLKGKISKLVLLCKKLVKVESQTERVHSIMVYEFLWQGPLHAVSCSKYLW